MVGTSCAFAQTQGNRSSETASPPDVLFYRTAQGAGQTVTVKAVAKDGAPVEGAPYSAQITTESVQTLADGNRIVATTTGLVARDSLGRTRQQLALPAIGNLSASLVPQIAIIQDPVAQVAYTLNLTNKTAHKMPGLPAIATAQGVPAPAGPGQLPPLIIARGGPAGGGPFPPPPSKDVVFLQKGIGGEPGQTTAVDLGSQIIEGVVANGTRAILTIPAGQVGNEKPISVVTDVWTAPDLRVIVSSRRSDPRIGERTFRLTNLDRNEPDPSLFAVPPDFTMIDGPGPVFYSPAR
jgi:hypothetical protein